MTEHAGSLPRLKLISALPLCATLLAACTCAAAQANAPTAAAAVLSDTNPLPSPTFEVVSIHQDKPSPDGRISTRIGFMPNGTFTVQGLNIRKLISMAYDIDEMQLSGGPDWLASDRYSIEARADSSTQQQLPKLTGPQSRIVGQHMVQTLLADRFGLKIHPDTKQMQVLALVPAKSGQKLHASTPGDTYPNGLKDRDGHGHQGMMRMNDGKITAQGVPLDNLASQLTQQLHQIVQNKTGLKGNFDFTLEWTPDHDRDGGPPMPGGASAADATGPSIYTAIQEQLGLKLEAQKSAVPVFVIDRVERPTEN